MKNIYKKIMIMFVMVLGIMGGYSINAFADESIKINNTILNYKKIVYVDSIEGSDTTGDGSISKPYKTFDFAYKTITSDNNEAIVLGQGKYTISVCDCKLKSMDIIGKGKNTSLFLKYSLRRLNNSQRVMYIIDNMKFYDLVFSTDIAGANLFMTRNTYFYNVAIAPEKEPEYSYFCNYDKKYPSYFINCSDITNIRYLLRGNFNVINSYGKFSIGTDTSDDDIKYTSSVITNTPYFDENYKITGNEEIRSNVGVYSGTFAWDNLNKNEKSITLDKSSLTLQEETSKDLVATTTPEAVDLVWNSSDESIATVDQNGKVTGVKEGTCTITAQIKDTDIKATCIVAVTKKDVPAEPEQPVDPEQEYIINTAYAKGDNTNKGSGSVTIIFHGATETTLSVVKTADVKEVWVGDNFTYTIVVTNTGSKTAKDVVVSDDAPNHINFKIGEITTTKGKVDGNSTSEKLIVNVGDILPGESVTIKVPVIVVE